MKKHENDLAAVTQAFVGGVVDVLGSKLYGVYAYGAAVFEDGGPVQDVDCHVILNEPLVDAERDALMALFARLADSCGPLGGDIDAFFILVDDAKKSDPPHNQLTVICDEWWALHCAHIRAGRYRTLWGPEPSDIFPAPAWSQVAAALLFELNYIRGELAYPAYCVLNLCRVIHSFIERDAVKSKHSSGLWASGQFPEWGPLIRAAMRHYAKTARGDDESLLQDQVRDFLAFAEDRIGELRDTEPPNQSLQGTR